MPTYDYVCLSCKHEFEEFQSITAKPLETCPECGQKIKRKIGGGAGLLFKGSGFYITDYKNNGQKKKSEETKPAKTEEKETKKAS